MTVKFETVLDALRTQIPLLTGFTTKTELPNPYSPEDNPKGILRNGWGLTVGTSVSGPAEFNSTVDLHSVGVVLTSEWVSTENNPATIHTVVKALKADAATLQKKLERGDLLAVSSSLENFTYASTSEVAFGEGERDRWVYLTVNFIASIREDLT
jgi:hypothetical protein